MAKRLKLKLNKQLIDSALGKADGSVINKILYDVCKQYPKHVNAKQVIAKVLIIGRTYSATIERKRQTKLDGDKFYSKKVAPQIIESKIDQWLKNMNAYNEINSNSICGILEVHAKVSKLFRKINGNIEKRSLASKYLHFHFPKLFYIFDTRASWAIPKLTDGTFTPGNSKLEYDRTYANFVSKCLKLKETIKSRYKRDMRPKNIDNLLLHIYAKHKQ